MEPLPNFGNQNEKIKICQEKDINSKDGQEYYFQLQDNDLVISVGSFLNGILNLKTIRNNLEPNFLKELTNNRLQNESYFYPTFLKQNIKPGD